MSAKVDIEKFTAELTARINRSISATSMKRLGDLALRLIKARVRDGYGVDSPGGPKRRLKPLAKSTIERRKRMRLSPFTSARKSNATMTGKMIAGLRVTTRTGIIQIEPTGVGANYAGFYSEERPFLNLSAGETKQLSEHYESQILDLKRL